MLQFVNNGSLHESFIIYLPRIVMSSKMTMSKIGKGHGPVMTGNVNNIHHSCECARHFLSDGCQELFEAGSEIPNEPPPAGHPGPLPPPLPISTAGTPHHGVR
jgi:hypothetical protein